MYKNKKKAVLWLLFFIVTSLFFLSLQLIDHPLLHNLIKEDGLLENSSALLYFTASVFFIILWKKTRFRNIWYLGFFLMFFLVAGEEISWGQRIFNLSTPESLVEINVQQETNFHNIKGIHGSVRLIGLIIVVGICYIIPFTNKVSKLLNNFYSQIKMPIFSFYNMLLPTIAILYMAIPRVFLGGLIHPMDEVGEMYLSLVFFIFALDEIILFFRNKEKKEII